MVIIKDQIMRIDHKGPSINDLTHFLYIFDPSLPLVTRFTKETYGVTSPSIWQNPIPP